MLQPFMFRSQLFFARLSVVVALTFVSTSTAWATLTASDSFNYALGGTYAAPADGSANVSSTNWTGGYGFSSNGWGVGGSGDIASVNDTVSVVSGLAFGNLATSGNAMRVTAASTANAVSGERTAYLSRAITGSASSGDLWVSFLFQSSGANGTWMNTATSQFATSGLTYRVTPYHGGSMALDGGLNTYPGGAGVPNDGSTYLCIARWRSNQDMIAYGLSLDDFNTISADGVVTEAEVASHNHAVVGGGYAATVALNSGAFLQLTSLIGGDGSSAATKTSIYDEIRIGTTLADVTPIPEPGAMAMVCSGLFGLLAYAWRKRG